MSTDTATLENSLVDHFLIAMPQLQDPYFANSVVYIWRHSSDGALGLVINLPLGIPLAEIFEQLGMEDQRSPGASDTVLAGGPVETEKGFVLHDAPPRWPSSLAVADGITLTTSRDILAEIARGEGPDNYLVALGCSGWSPGQLEKELKENSWLACQATHEIIFSRDYARKPQMAAATLGFSLSQLTPDIGYS